MHWKCSLIGQKLIGLQSLCVCTFIGLKTSTLCSPKNQFNAYSYCLWKSPSREIYDTGLGLQALMCTLFTALLHAKETLSKTSIPLVSCRTNAAQWLQTDPKRIRTAFLHGMSYLRELAFVVFFMLQHKRNRKTLISSWKGKCPFGLLKNTTNGQIFEMIRHSSGKKRKIWTQHFCALP